MAKADQWLGLRCNCYLGEPISAGHMSDPKDGDVYCRNVNLHVS